MTDASDEQWMQLALAEADRAAAIGEVPVGCVIVAPTRSATTGVPRHRSSASPPLASADDPPIVVATGYNLREQEADPTAHAEIVAMRAAARARGSWRLDDCTLYVTLEPCVMCAGALVNARMGRVVWGCDDPKAGACATLYTIGQDSRLNHRFATTRGVLEIEAADRLKRFFASLRALGKK